MRTFKFIIDRTCISMGYARLEIRCVHPSRLTTHIKSLWIPTDESILDIINHKLKKKLSNEEIMHLLLTESESLQEMRTIS